MFSRSLLVISILVHYPVCQYSVYICRLTCVRGGTDKMLLRAQVYNRVLLYIICIIMLCVLVCVRHAIEVNKRDYRAWYGLGQTYEILKMPFYSVYYYRKAHQLRYVVCAYVCDAVRMWVTHS